MPSPYEARRPPRQPVTRTLALAIVAIASVAHAAKWRHCPDQLGYHPSRIGAVSSSFIHPGRELGIFLSDREIADTGGFSIKADGNIVQVTYASLFGAPVDIPAFTTTAVSWGTLYFRFPDAAVLLGRTLAGPVAITVTSDGRTTADILPRHLVALPPANDVRALVDGAAQQGALATMDTRGAIWIPVQFSSYGTMMKPMMTCPGTFTPKRAFGVGVTVRAIPSFVKNAPPAYPPLRSLRRVDVFLGDFLINGVNYYGMAVGKLPVFRVPRGYGIKVCGVNDAVDLALRAAGSSRWAKPWSGFGAWMPASKPMDIILSQTSVDDGSTSGGVDSFGTACLLN